MEEVNSTLFRVIVTADTPHSFDPHTIAADFIKDQPFRQQHLTPSGRASLRITNITCVGGKGGKPTYISYKGVCAPSCEVEEHPIYCFQCAPNPNCQMVVRNLKFRADLDGESVLSVSGPGTVTIVGELYWSFDHQESTETGKRGRAPGGKAKRADDAEVGEDEDDDSDDMYGQGIVYD